MRKMIIAGFLLANLSAISQKASIVGIAIDSLNNHVMKGAELLLQPGYQIQYTDSNGYFNFSNLSIGSYEISGSHLGCIVTTQKITITGQEIIQQNINFVCHEIIHSTIPTLTSETLREVTIEATRATSITPMTYNDLSKQYIEHINTSQDIPQLLRYTPSLVATSDAGNGVGYTGLWIRGSDPSRINVTINGIPLNDPESQQVFWVNTPDLASSASNIQIQRGIGTSANGAASFGGNIKIETRDVRTSPYAEIKNSFGSFNTMRNTINVGTGLIHQKFVFEGRLSRIVSDGYIDRATSDLKSYFLEGNYMDRKTTIKLSMFGGRERTYQSWYGTPVSVLQNNQDSIFQFAARNYLDDTQLSNLLNSGRTYNFYEYENQIDNYGQDHYQLHVSREITSNLRLHISGHYTHGEGYYEEFKAFQDYNSYGLDHVVTGNDTVTTTDLVRRRWLKNDFYGMVASLSYKRNAFESSLGGAFNEYIGNHYGEIVWMQFSGPYEKNQEYYRGRSVKHDGNIYWRNSYLIQKKLALYADLQLRSVVYATNGNDNDLRDYDIHDQLLFINPKLGAKYFLKSNQIFYASVAMGSKEPNRNDYVDAPPGKEVKHEAMTDAEFGYQYNHQYFNISANGYYMNYHNQLVLTGELNDVGAPLRMNVEKSFRRGIELQAASSWRNKIIAQANITLSQNKISAFDETIYDYTNDITEARIFKHENTDIAFSPSMIGGASIGYFMTVGRRNHELRCDLFSKYVGKQYLDNTSNELLTIDPYFIQDIKFDMKLLSHHGYSMELAFFIHNFLDVQYSSNGYTYSYYYETRITERFYYPQAGRNYSVNLILNF